MIRKSAESYFKCHKIRVTCSKSNTLPTKNTPLSAAARVLTKPKMKDYKTLVLCNLQLLSLSFGIDLKVFLSFKRQLMASPLYIKHSRSSTAAL